MEEFNYDSYMCCRPNSEDFGTCDCATDCTCYCPDCDCADLADDGDDDNFLSSLEGVWHTVFAETPLEDALETSWHIRDEQARARY